MTGVKLKHIGTIGNNRMAHRGYISAYSLCEGLCALCDYVVEF